MALRRGRDVHDVRRGFLHQLRQITEVPPNTESLGKLLGHQLFPVTDADQFASLDSLDLRRMRVRDLPAPNDGYPKHDAPSLGSSRSRH